MEAENYLSSGYGLRIAIEERAVGWMRLGSVARATMPNRTKATLVSPEDGTPFLAATQVFDIRPISRKWLAIGKISGGESLFVKPGTILITRSGNVGRSTLATDALKGVLVSDDLIRVEAREPEQSGWLYAYLQSPQARAMMSGAQYGAIIKHLEVPHLEALPVPVVKPQIAADFQTRTETILTLRNRAHALATQAEERFATAIGPVKSQHEEDGFEVKASALFTGRRRLEASYHAPHPASILRRFTTMKATVMPLSSVTEKVWWMKRFRRFYGDAGIPYLEPVPV